MKCKIVMLGIGAVGKSAISIQFVQGKFVFDYDPTIAANYSRTSIIDGKTINIEIFDTAGMETFNVIMNSTIKAGDAFILIYDITDRASFDTIRHYYEEILQIKNTDKISCVLCGNKCDLSENRQVSKSEGEELAKSIGLTFFETSAKENINIKESYEEAIRKVWSINGLNMKNNDSTKKKKSICLLI